jgi:diphthamide biosynthesis protein 2
LFDGVNPTTHTSRHVAPRSCCVDEVAALHADADCVVHYGRSCLSPVSRLPSRLVYSRQPVDVEHLAPLLVEVRRRHLASLRAALLRAQLPATVVLTPPLPAHNPVTCTQHVRQCVARVVLLLLDQECVHASAALQAAVLRAQAGASAGGTTFVYADAPTSELEPPAAAAGSAASQRSVTAAGCCGGGGCAAREPAAAARASVPEPSAATATAAAAAQSDCLEMACGVTWQLPPGVALADCSLVWVGGANASLLRLLMSLPLGPDGCALRCARYDPTSRAWEPSAGQAEEAARLLKRRYYLVERAKQASIVGLLAGTLGVAGFRGALERARGLAEAAGKRTYTFLVGKPNPAKLANFPEVRRAQLRLLVQAGARRQLSTCGVPCAAGGGVCAGGVPAHRVAGFAGLPGAHDHRL